MTLFHETIMRLKLKNNTDNDSYVRIEYIGLYLDKESINKLCSKAFQVGSCIVNHGMCLVLDKNELITSKIQHYHDVVF